MAIDMYRGVPGFASEQKEMLEQPLNSSHIKHRPGGGGRQLAYITGKNAIDTANKIFGFGQWGYKVVARELIQTTDVDGNRTSEYYAADIELYVVGSAFSFPGDGIGIVVPPRVGSVAEAHEKARKEAVTDALKRALRHYGAQFGNDLYDEDALVEVGEEGNGTLVSVKNVQRANTGQGQKRTVDANPTGYQQRQQGAPTSNHQHAAKTQQEGAQSVSPSKQVNVPQNAVKPSSDSQGSRVSPSTVDALQAEWATVCDIPDVEVKARWKAFKSYILKAYVDDADLVEAQYQQLKAYVVQQQQKKFGKAS